MTHDLPNHVSSRPKDRKHQAFCLHVGCSLLGAFWSIRSTSSSGQDFKPALQAGRPPAYSSLGVPRLSHNVCNRYLFHGLLHGVPHV